MKRGRAAGVAGLMVCLGLMGAASADSATMTLYVDAASRGGRCSDTRTAVQVSAKAPLCTLPRALALLTSGGTVLVRDADYPKLTIGEEYAQTTNIKAYPGTPPRLAGVLFLPSARNIRLEGFRITDITDVQGQKLALVANDMSPHGIVMNGNDNLAEGNSIHDLRIVFDERSTAPRCHRQWELTGGNDQDGDGEYDHPLSETGGIAPRCGYAFRVKGANQVIRRNVVRRVPADGIQAFGTSNLLVEGNSFTDIAVQSHADGGDPLEHPDGAQVIGDNTNATFRNNVFTDTRGILSMVGADSRWPTDLRVEGNVIRTATKNSGAGDGCIHASAVTGMTIANNTCWGDGTFEPAVRITDDAGSETTGVFIKNNVMERFATAREVQITEDHNLIKTYAAGPGIAPGSHTSIGSPTFVAGDPFLRLAAGSPGIDAGTSVGTPDRDRESHPRCDEASVPNTGEGPRPYFDIGAHEFGSGGASCTGPPVAEGYAALVASDGPVSHWRLGEPTGTVAGDRMDANRGSYVGGATLGQPGAIPADTAVRLNGSTGQIKVPDSASLDTGDSFTVEMWLKRSRLRVSEGLAAKGSYLIFLDSADYVTLRKPNVGNIARSTVGVSNTTGFHHVVVTKSGAATRIYIDGVDRTGAVVNRAIANSASPLLFGAGAGGFSGTLDEIAVYPRALTAAEVAEHRAAG